MKKKIILLTALLMTTILLISCSSTPKETGTIYAQIEILERGKVRIWSYYKL